MITPITIASGTLISQVFLLIIVALGATLLNGPGGSYFSRIPISMPSLPAVILAMALLSLGALLFSSGLTGTWSPLLGTMAPPGIPDGWALLWVILIDVGGLSFLVAGTGGSQQSPFQATYFLLPTLAIFLRQSTPRVLFTAALVAVSFSLCMRVLPDDHPRQSVARTNRLSYWFVSLASMALGLYIGLATRLPS